jgi:hypothetical protein
MLDQHATAEPEVEHREAQTAECAPAIRFKRRHDDLPPLIELGRKLDLASWLCQGWNYVTLFHQILKLNHFITDYATARIPDARDPVIPALRKAEAVSFHPDAQPA